MSEFSVKYYLRQSDTRTNRCKTRTGETLIWHQSSQLARDSNHQNINQTANFGFFTTLKNPPKRAKSFLYEYRNSDCDGIKCNNPVRPVSLCQAGRSLAVCTDRKPARGQCVSSGTPRGDNAHFLQWLSQQWPWFLLSASLSHAETWLDSVMMDLAWFLVDLGWFGHGGLCWLDSLMRRLGLIQSRWTWVDSVMMDLGWFSHDGPGLIRPRWTWVDSVMMDLGWFSHDGPGLIQPWWTWVDSAMMDLCWYSPGGLCRLDSLMRRLGLIRSWWTWVDSVMMDFVG